MKYFFIKLSTVANGIFIWSQFTFAQNVGVNTDGTSPTELLHVKSTTASQNHLLIQHTLGAQELALRLYNSATASANWKLYVPASSSDLRLYNAADRVTFLSTGQVGINMSPTMMLDVTSATTTADEAIIRGAATGNARVYGVLGSATATTTNASGIRGSATGVGLVNGVWGEANGAAAVAGVYGSTTSTTNGATGISGSASGASGIISGVVGFTNSTTTYATGVYGEATVAGADAMDGYNSAAAGASDGYGVWGITSQSAGFGVAANNWNSAGTGVLGMGNNTSAFWNPNSAGAGGIFNGLRYGIVSGIDNENTAGTGYGYGAVYASIEGVTETNVGANTTLYHFAIHGTNNDYGVGFGLRTGGVIGRETYTGAWACLGYQSSAAASRYGLYYTSAGTGAGFLPDGIINGIGAGGFGGIIGSWTRGEVMGHISAGELFASYNLGNEYTSGYSAEVVTLSDKRVAAYAMTSTDIKVYNDGTGKLSNGKAKVNFDASFTELIGDNKPVVTITPMGQCNGIYIANVDSKGFDVIELNNGNSNVEFSFIVISKRIDAENKPQLPEALSKKDFDEKMKGVMFNENDLEHSATPIWWDGSQLRFDEITTKQGNLKPLPGLEVNKKALGLKDGKAAFKKRIINEEK